MADVDEVGFAKGLGHPVVRSPQPVVLGDQPLYSINFSDSEFRGMRRGQVGRRREVVKRTGGG
jgi:hypothetical protein